MTTKKSRRKARLIKELEENPLIERACRKLDISRASYYRWRKEDPRFKDDAEIAQEKGRAKLNDFVESKLLENINNNQQPAINFWLSHNTVRYQHQSQQHLSYKAERMKQALWSRTEILNSLIDKLGKERFLKLAEASDYESLLKEIDAAYEEDQIRKGYRGKRGYRPLWEPHFRYPDEADFDV